MIKSFTDHAANERTYLAWVRTAIAVMAFGFLVVKFDLLLGGAAGSVGVRLSSPAERLVGDVAALLLILLGGSMMVTSTIRYRQLSRAIDAPEPRPAGGERLDVVLIGMLLTLGGTLFAYVFYTIVSRLT